MRGGPHRGGADAALLRRGQTHGAAGGTTSRSADLPVLAANNLQTAVQHLGAAAPGLEQAELPAPWWPGSRKLDTGAPARGAGRGCPPFIGGSAGCKNVVQPFSIMTHFSRSR